MVGPTAMRRGRAGRWWLIGLAEALGLGAPEWEGLQEVAGLMACTTP